MLSVEELVKNELFRDYYHMLEGFSSFFKRLCASTKIVNVHGDS